MVRLFSHKNRPAHFGSYLLERLNRQDQAPAYNNVAAANPLQIENAEKSESLANGMRTYIDVMDRMRTGDVAPAEAPIPEDEKERANHLKAACYYLDASMAGTCRVPKSAILESSIINHSLANAMEQEFGVGAADNPMAEISVREGKSALQRAQTQSEEPLDHESALAIVVEYTRDPSPEEPGGNWLADTQAQRAALRAAEVGAVIANYLRMLGFDARLHTATASDLDLDQILLAAGLGEVVEANGSAQVAVPYLGRRFGVVAVSTSMALAADRYLAPGATKKGKNFSWWLGLGGSRPGYQGALYQKRAFHQGLYPMEKVKRVKEPTTLIDAANVPRIPKRHDMFIRASIGDLGAKAEKELHNFRMITKSPFGHAMIPVLGGMVPLQYGREDQNQAEGYEDPARNAQLIKAAMYYLGADMVGICEIPEYAWF